MGERCINSEKVLFDEIISLCRAGTKYAILTDTRKRGAETWRKYPMSAGYFTVWSMKARPSKRT